MDRSSKQNVNKDIAALNNVLHQMDLTDIYRAFHPKEAKYTFFSNAHGTFSKIDHMIGHKTSLNRFKRRIHQEDINIVNIYVPNIGTPNI